MTTTPTNAHAKLSERTSSHQHPQTSTAGGNDSTGDALEFARQVTGLAAPFFQWAFETTAQVDLHYKTADNLCKIMPQFPRVRCSDRVFPKTHKIKNRSNSNFNGFEL